MMQDGRGSAADGNGLPEGRGAAEHAALRASRTARGISLEQVTRDIHISKRFLQALEAGDYADLPGQAYVTGFIRSYADYLDLDPEPLIDHYRSQRTASAGAEAPPVRSRAPLAVLALALLVLAAGIGALVRWVIAPASAERPAEAPAAAPPAPFVMAGETVIRVLQVGAVVRVPIGDRFFDVLLARYDDGLVIRYGDNEQPLAVGGERLLDLDGDSRTDLRMLFNSVDRSGDPVRVNLTLQRGAAGEPAPEPAPAAPAPAPAGDGRVSG